MNLPTVFRKFSRGYDAGSAFQSLMVPVWEETVLVNVSSSIWTWNAIECYLSIYRYCFTLIAEYYGWGCVCES